MVNADTQIKLTPPQVMVPLDLGYDDQVLDLMSKHFYQLGDIYRVYSPSRRRYTYVLSHPDYVKHVLQTNNKNYIKGEGIDRVKILLGNGIMVSEGDFWRQQRRMIQPAFHRQVIAGLKDLIVESNLQMIEEWREKTSSGHPLNINDEMSKVTLHIVLNAIFSEDLLTLTSLKGNNPFDLLTKETERNLQFAMKFRSLGPVIQKIVDQRRAQGRVCHDFLSMLMESRDKETGQPMPDKQLLDEVMTLVIAGHETTASALVWTWYLLTQYPGVEQRLHQEVKQVLGSNLPSFEHLQRLTYTKQVIQEALRLYPPGWLLTRINKEDDQIGPFFIPKGSDIYISPYLVHRNAKFWSHPDEFVPDRFDPEITEVRPRFAYFPFGAGPRQCIGDHFAMVEMQFLISMVMAQVKFSLVKGDPVEVEPQINLRSRYPIFLKAHWR